MNLTMPTRRIARVVLAVCVLISTASLVLLAHQARARACAEKVTAWQGFFAGYDRNESGYDEALRLAEGKLPGRISTRAEAREFLRAVTPEHCGKILP